MAEQAIIHRNTHTEEYVLQAFWKLYARKPLSQITVRELTQLAGINRSTFYSHYLDMYDLLAEAEDALLGQLEALLDGQLNGQDALSPMNAFFQYYHQNIDKLSLLLGPAGDPAFLTKVLERFIPVVMAHLEIDAADREASELLSFLISGVLGYLSRWYQRHGTFPPQESILSIRDALVNGFESALAAHTENRKKLSRFIQFDTLQG